MANFNKVILVGRLTRDPEIRATGTGMKIAGIGFAVTNRKKNQQTGQWEDEPMFIDVTAFDRPNEGRGLASTVEQYCRKGSQIMIEGKLTLDSWEDKNGGGKRTKHKIIADVIQLLDSRGSGPGGDAGMDDDMDAGAPRSNNAAPPRAVSRPPAARPTTPPRAPAKQYDDAGDDRDGGNGDDPIPF